MHNFPDTLRAKLSHLPNWAPIAIVLAGLLLISAIIILLIARPNSPSPTDDQEFTANTYDITDQPATPPSLLTDAAATDPHKDYTTAFDSTEFASLTAQAFCATAGFSCSDILAQPLTELSTLTPNILNFYLDHNYAVIISSRATTTVIYGAIYTTPNYLTFTTSQTDLDTYSYTSPAELFNPLSGSEDFYVIRVNN